MIQVKCLLIHYFVRASFHRHEREISRNLLNCYVCTMLPYVSYHTCYLEDLSVSRSFAPQHLSSTFIFLSFSPKTSLKRTDGNINYFKQLMRCKGTCEILLWIIIMHHCNKHFSPSCLFSFAIYSLLWGWLNFVARTWHSEITFVPWLPSFKWFRLDGGKRKILIVGWMKLLVITSNSNWWAMVMIKHKN